MSRPPEGEIGPVAASAAVVASMIGAGIYTSPGFTLADLGTPAWTLAAWAVGGLIAVCGAIGYAALASRISESGGEYTYLTRVVHPLAGFLAGWVSLTAGFAGAGAVAAIAFAEYALPAGNDGRWLAGALVVAASCLHGWRVRPAAGVQTGAVALKLLIVAGLLLTAAPHVVINPDGPPTSSTVSPGRFAEALMWIALSTSGFNAAIYFSGEVRDPTRNVPRALIWGTVLTTGVYLGIVAVVCLTVSPEDVRGRPDALAIVAASVGGGTGRSVVTGLICLSLLTSVSATAMTGPRVTAQMAADGRFPRWFRTPDAVPPRTAILLHTAIALLFVAAGTLRDLIPQIGATLGLSAAGAVATVLRPSFGASLAARAAAAAFVTATLLSFAVAVWNDPRTVIAAAAILATGAVAWLPLGARNQTDTTDHVDSTV